MFIAAFIVETQPPVEDNICYSVLVHSFHCVLLSLGDCLTTWKYLLFISHQSIVVIFKFLNPVLLSWCLWNGYELRQGTGYNSKA